MSAHPALTMAVLTIVGGIAGYVRTRSIPSIAAGTAVGGLYLASWDRIRTGAANGYEGALASSVLLLLSSLPRVTKGPVPLALTVTSSLAAGYYGKTVYDFRQ
ncbi:hypothetical protein BS47DRAFT_250547 [Hydnum rufescens UP504]|uniref:Uncharacterized protein n=1 Tax=Hydnum rufescens UP504 TaxID=1448309 RepID=A0A9P6AMT5_9AGAM|nr:hypothetical protein BS47DRAFT_250547 [Hydnum rufescens UP504]